MGAGPPRRWRGARETQGLHGGAPAGGELDGYAAADAQRTGSRTDSAAARRWNRGEGERPLFGFGN